jgi:hypothetical protein
MTNDADNDAAPIASRKRSWCAPQVICADEAEKNFYYQELYDINDIGVSGPS